MNFNKLKTPFIIAEVGQNHQGNEDLALKYINEFSNLGASAVKFQLRDNRNLFSNETYNKEYDNNNSFGSTYGEHRKKLELNFSTFKKIANLCRKKNIKFMATPFDENSLKKLIKLNVDILKIASFDLGNIPFIDMIAKYKKPIVMSTGGGNLKIIDNSVRAILKHHSNLSILHCVSEYPCEYDKLGLENIKILKRKYKNITIGVSDHFNGILSGPISYMLGARVFEKHVTFNRGWKGSDHSFSLEPNGFGKFVRDINRTPKMMSSKDKSELGKEKVFSKLGKSLIFNKNLSKGEKVLTNDLSWKIIDKNGILVRDSYKIIDKYLKKSVTKGELVKLNILSHKKI